MTFWILCYFGYKRKLHYNIDCISFNKLLRHTYKIKLLLCKIQKIWCSVTVTTTTVDIHRPLQTRHETRCREESASPAWLAAPAMTAQSHLCWRVLVDVSISFPKFSEMLMFSVFEEIIHVWCSHMLNWIHVMCKYTLYIWNQLSI